jgi:hypothetical protein
MKSVRYLKVVLTVIAACLVLICLRDVSLIRTASAKTDWIPGRYQVVADGQGVAFRVDSLSGQVCTYVATMSDFQSCTSPGK